MQTKIQKWGNSLGLRIPKSFAKQAGVEAGTNVDLSIEGSDLIVRSRRRQRYRLQDLLKQVTAKNLHKEVGTGAPVGREAW
jgi:antitoxin MazE